MSNTEWTWSDVEGIIEDLKRDGYQPTELKSTTSEAAPEKAFLLEVKRSENTGSTEVSDDE